MADELQQSSVSALVASRRDESEDVLIAEARRHSNAAIAALMRRYNRRLYRVARSILRDDDAAEDAVQECYVRAFMNLDRYRPIGSFGAWLTRIAINEALMIRRRAHRTFVSLDEADLESADRGVDTLDTLASSDAAQAENARQLLELAVDSLPQTFRMVFMLRVVEQLSVAETAECLEINEATVKTRLHRAQARLRATISRRLRREQVTLFEFGGRTCDRIVARVLARLSSTCISSATL